MYTRGEFVPSLEYLEKKAKNPDWVWPRSDSHMVLGIPGSMECYKTWVEPGNSFSPGIASFGVSVWVKDEKTGKLYVPETMNPGDFEWHFSEGKLPVVVSRWKCGGTDVESRLFKREEQYAYCDYLRVIFLSAAASDFQVYLVIRSFGPCGGCIKHAEEKGDGKTILINGFPLAEGLQGYDEFAAVDCSREDRDIGTYIQNGRLPENKKAEDIHGWCSLTAMYRVHLEAESEKELAWQFPVYLPVSRASELIPFRPFSPGNPKKSEEKAVSEWKSSMQGMEVDVPDKRFNDAFYAQMLHMLMMITGNDVRIETSFYPLFWLRDGVYIINALEKGGYRELAKKALEKIITGDFYGGFSSEADAPAEGIWALAEHYLFCRDTLWLEEVYPAIRRKAAWIERMMKTDQTLYDYSTEMVAGFIRASMVNGLVCYPVKNGIIQGNMDHHIPYYWINCWAVYGLRLASMCAGILGFHKDESRYDELSKNLHENLMKYFPENFRETPVSQGIYSFGVALWPTHAFDAQTVRKEFDTWWKTWRCPRGIYNIAWDWTYFEAAQAHNYLFLGDWERFHIMLERYFRYQDVPGLYGYNEGKNARKPDGSSVYGGQDWGFGNILDYRGWDNFDSNMPHNWVSSELYLMMRDSLLFEDNKTLVVGAGIPREWNQKGNKVEVKNAATHFGTVSYTLIFETAKLVLNIVLEKGDVSLRVWIPSLNIDMAFDSWDEAIHISL
jgi:hypothetical protein